MTIVAPADGKAVAAIEKLTGQTIAWAGEPAPSAADEPRARERIRVDGRHARASTASGTARTRPTQAATPERPAAEVARIDEARSRRRPRVLA